MEKDYLTISNLTKVYNANTPGEVLAVDDLSIAIKEGEFVTIVGGNAAGKSTLFNLIAGSLTPAVGRIVLDGVNITHLPEHLRSKFISRVCQNPNDSLIASMTLAENLAMAKMRAGRVGLSNGIKARWRKEFIELLGPLGLDLETRLDDGVNLLSGGQKQAVALLMATMTKPKLLLLDEHTAALDPKISKQVLDITCQIVQQQKVTTLMITHNIQNAINYGDRLIMLEQGRVVLDVAGEAKRSLKLIDIIDRLG